MYKTTGSIGRIKYLKAEYDSLSKRINNLKISYFGVDLSFIAGFSFIFAIFSSSYLATVISNRTIVLIIASGFVSGAGLYIYAVFFLKYVLESYRRRIEYDLIREGAKKLRENLKKEIYEKLVDIKFKYFDQYYLLTKEQADKGFIFFILMTISSVSGLVSVAATGLILILYEKPDPAYLTTIAGIITEFISVIFFFMYNETVLKMSDYHNKLVLSQNISLALKIADDLLRIEKNGNDNVISFLLNADIQMYLKEMAQDERSYSDIYRPEH